MLVRFSFENWLSFRDRTTFSMVASRERQHGERVSKLHKYSSRLLPVAAIYGGNASGKSNFFKALAFAKELIVNGTPMDALIPVKPFRLDPKTIGQPSKFSFELLIDRTIYEYSFAVTREAVLEERLVEIMSTREKVLYDRQGEKTDLKGPLNSDAFLNFVSRGTRRNQLFLNNAVSQKIELFRPIYDWFKKTLTLISPDACFGFSDSFFDEDHPHHAVMSRLLEQLDTGIFQLGGEEIPFESIPKHKELETILERLREGETTNVMLTRHGDRFSITRKEGELISTKMVTHHQQADGEQVRFEFSQESDGSQRLIDLLPAFIDLFSKTGKRVYIIDELDRSLHTLLTRRLLENYLKCCDTKTQSQLLFTTHDVLLMDQQLLRRDEMWVAERDEKGGSALHSFSDYADVRYDKDIRKSYLQGRLGGIPHILIQDALCADPCLEP